MSLCQEVFHLVQPNSCSSNVPLPRFSALSSSKWTFSSSLSGHWLTTYKHLLGESLSPQPLSSSPSTPAFLHPTSVNSFSSLVGITLKD